MYLSRVPFFNFCYQQRCWWFFDRVCLPSATRVSPTRCEICSFFGPTPAAAGCQRPQLGQLRADLGRVMTKFASLGGGTQHTPILRWSVVSAPRLGREVGQGSCHGPGQGWPNEARRMTLRADVGRLAQPGVDSRTFAFVGACCCFPTPLKSASRSDTGRHRPTSDRRPQNHRRLSRIKKGSGACRSRLIDTVSCRSHSILHRRHGHDIGDGERGLHEARARRLASPKFHSVIVQFPRTSGAGGSRRSACCG